MVVVVVWGGCTRADVGLQLGGGGEGIAGWGMERNRLQHVRRGCAGAEELGDAEHVCVHACGTCLLACLHPGMCSGWRASVSGASTRIQRAVDARACSH